MKPIIEVHSIPDCGLLTRGHAVADVIRTITEHRTPEKGDTDKCANYVFSYQVKVTGNMVRIY